MVSKSYLVSPYKLMGMYMGDLILGVILQYMVYASFSCFSQEVKSFKLFPIGSMGLIQHTM